MENDGLLPESNSLKDPEIVKITEDMPEHLRDMFTRAISDLPKEQIIEVAKLVKEFQDIFAKNYLDVGTYNASKFHIDTGNAKPIKLKFRRTPLHYQEQERNQLQDLLDRGIIRPSQSPWAAAPVLVKKKSYGLDACTQSHIRYCLDYRELNKVTTAPAYPLPNLNDLINFLGCSSWFSKLDCANGYYQIQIDEESIPKTAFACAYGLYEWTVLCYGLKGAPAAFQQAMGIVLNGLLGKITQAYLDDVTVTGETFNKHIDNLRTVFLRFRQYGMKLKPSKCELFQKQTEFLGRHISKDGISINEDQLKVIENWPRPENVKELRQFLGYANWLRPFIKNFAHDALPLYQLLKKDQAYIWTERQESGFISLRHKLSSPPCLAYAKPEGSFHLEVDASKKACGAMLYQWQEYQGKQTLRLISCFSAVFTPAQTRWCSSRQELLALVRAIREYRVYLLGKKFTVCTDCRVVSFLFSFKDPQGVLARIQEELGTYDFDIKHKKGCLMVCPDALSRMPDKVFPCNQYRAGCKPEDLPCHSSDKQCAYCQRAYRQWHKFETEVDYVIPLGVSNSSPNRDNLRYFDTEDQIARTIHSPTELAKAQLDLSKSPKDTPMQNISVKSLFDVKCASTSDKPGDLNETIPYSTDFVPDNPGDLDETLPYGIDTNSNFDPDLDVESDPESTTDHDLDKERLDEYSEFDELDGYDLLDEPSPEVGDIFAAPAEYHIKGQKYVEIVHNDKLIELQKQDKYIGILLKWLENSPNENELSSSPKALKMYWLCKDQLIFKNGILYYSWLNRPWCQPCLVVPEVLRPFVLYHSHASPGLGHFGRDRILQRLRRSFFWYGMHDDAVQYIKSCETCLKNKKTKRKPRAKQVLYSPGYVNQRLHLDIYGPINPVTNNGNKYILTMIDGFSRFVQMAPLNEHSAEKVAASMIEKWISVFGFPTEIFTDQGREFQSNLLSTFCKQFEIAKLRTSPYHPQSNSVLERYHAQLGAMLRSYITRSKYKYWDVFLPLLSLAHNTAVNECTQYSPYEMMFGHKCTFPVDLIFDLPDPFKTEVSPVEWVNNVRKAIENTHDCVRDHISSYKARSKKVYDLKAYERRYQIGTYVFKLDSVVPKGISKKLTPIYTGPLLVSKDKHPLYELTTKKGNKTVVHHDRLIAATPKFIPIVLKRQRAALMADANKSAQETLRMQKQNQHNILKELKAEEDAIYFY